MQVKRDPDLTGTPGPPPAKRLLSDDDSPIEKNATASVGTHIKISNRGKRGSGRFVFAAFRGRACAAAAKRISRFAVFNRAAGPLF